MNSTKLLFSTPLKQLLNFTILLTIGNITTGGFRKETIDKNGGVG